MRRPLLIASFALAAAGCTDTTGIGPFEQRLLREQLRQAIQRWEQADVDSYVLNLRRLCYCGEIDPRRITVVNGVVTDVRVEGSDTPLPEDHWQWYPSVEQLFVITREAIERPAHSIVPTYDAELGYPTNVAIDWSMNVADEEVTFEVMSLAASPMIDLRRGSSSRGR